MISAIGSIPVCGSDNFPEQICNECREKLKLCYVFKKKIVKSFELLCQTVKKKMLSPTSDLIQHNIKQEDADYFSSTARYDDHSSEVKKEKLPHKSVETMKRKSSKSKTDMTRDKVVAALQKLLKNRDKCPLCLHKITEDENMIDHFNSHYTGSDLTPLIVGGKKVKICNLCNRTFKYSVMIPHHRNHLKIFPFKCEMEDCGKSFVSSNYLTAHLDWHDGSKNYQCQTCGKTFLLRSSLTNHEETHVIEDARCEICNKTYKNNIMLKLHMRRHENGLKFKCDHSGCVKRFRLVHELNRHRKMHISEKEHICSTCNKDFFTITQLRRHEQVHLIVKKFKCNHCCKTFAERTQLRLHEMTHTGDRPHVCEFCSMTFVVRSKLKRHQTKSCKAAKGMSDRNSPNKD
ncbi:uncharacterized protein LOC143914420 isoform X2 [Arctopsyche grandis]